MERSPDPSRVEERDGATDASGLDPELRVRGRRMAIASHQAGMTFRFAFTEHLPTLALVELGAGEAIVGLQRAFEPLSQVLQLPTLRTVGRFRKRSILFAGQALAILGGLPLVAFALLASGSNGVPLAVTGLLVVSIGLVIAGTVWFPMLRGYVEPKEVGSFFGLLRSTWHLTLILFFLGAHRWIATHPGSFGLLFGVATLAGLLRLAVVTRLPEPPGELGTRVRMREAIRLLRGGTLRRYLLGTSLWGGVRRTVVPFAIVLMRRVMGLSDAAVLLTTIAYLAGGLVSLYLWGRVVDRYGPGPVFRITALGTSIFCFSLLGIRGSEGVIPMIVFFFGFSVMTSGFGVADTRVLFSLAPSNAPTRVFVATAVVSSLASAVLPLLSGVGLDLALGAGVEPLTAYRSLFVAAGLSVALALVPLRVFGAEVPDR